MHDNIAHIDRVYIQLHSSQDATKKMTEDVFQRTLEQLQTYHFADLNLSPVYRSYILSWDNGNVICFTGDHIFEDGNEIQKYTELAFQTFQNTVFYNARTSDGRITKNGLYKAFLTNVEVLNNKNLAMDEWERRFKELQILPAVRKDAVDELLGIHLNIEVVSVKTYPFKAIRDGNHFLCIAYDGSVMPCSYMCPDKEDHKQFILGNIMTDDLLDIYNSEKAERLREQKLRYEDGCLEICKHQSDRCN